MIGVDDDTVDTAGSDAGHSDVDVDPSEKPKLDHIEPEVSLGDRCREFFSGRMYKHMSAIFGTMVCFFLVGMLARMPLLIQEIPGKPILELRFG